MPPKKKQQQQGRVKVGKMRKYLTDNFGTLPDDVNSLKNGHLPFIHTINGRSIGKTIDTIVERLPCSTTYDEVRSLLKRAKKIKDVSSDKGMNRYSDLCSEAYTFKPQPMETVPSSSDCQEHIHLEVSTEDVPTEKPAPVTPDKEDVPTEKPAPVTPDKEDVPTEKPAPVTPDKEDVPTEKPAPVTPDKEDVPTEKPVPVTPNTVRSSIRNQRNLTPRRLKKRLGYLSLSRSVLKEIHRRKLVEVKSKIDFPRINKIKYLNQDINRLKLKLTVKENKIRALKLKLSQNSLIQELKKSKKALNNMQRNLQRLKASKVHTASSSCSGCESSTKKIRILMEELAEKNQTNLSQENENLVLKEAIDALKAGEKDTSLLKEGRT